MIELIVLGSIQATFWGGIAIVKLVKKYKKRNSPRHNVNVECRQTNRHTRSNNNEPLPMYLPEPPKYSLYEINNNDETNSPPSYSSLYSN
jgi:hypothetical protein